MEKYVHKTNEALLITHVLLGSNVLSYLADSEELSVLDKIESTIIGLYLADFTTGLIHLFLDNYRGEDKVLKKMADEFKEHHENVKPFMDLTIYELLLQTSFTPLALASVVLLPKSKKHKLTHIIATYAMHFAQVSHQAAHYINHATKEEKESVVGQMLQILQKNHIILKPEDHSAHHAAKYNDLNFGVVNGWSHPVLNEIVKIPFIYDFIFKQSKTSAA